MGRESAGNEVLSFTCDHCEISLTVDESLGGVTGPCPSCGESVTAPSPKVTESIKATPRQLPSRDFPSRSSESEDSGVPPQWQDRGGRGVERPRKINLDTTKSGSRRERDEVAAVAKMLAVGLVVLIVVLVVTYLLKHRIGA